MHAMIVINNNIVLYYKLIPLSISISFNQNSEDLIAVIKKNNWITGRPSSTPLITPN